MMVIAEVIERALVRLAKYEGVDDPESVAHDIIVRALEGHVIIQTQARGYLRRALRNTGNDRWRHTKRMVHCGLIENWLHDEPFKNDSIDAHLDVRRLADREPKGLAFMLDYVEADGPRPTKDRIRAMRLRRQMRVVLA